MAGSQLPDVGKPRAGGAGRLTDNHGSAQIIRPPQRVKTHETYSRPMRPKRQRPTSAPIFPPAPGWPRDESALLAETDAALALLLWQRARDVRLWALVPPDRRAGLFVAREDVETVVEEGEQLADAVAGPLRTLRALVRFPDLVTPADVCAACLAMSEWCEGEHMPEAALHYAEAAALADPTSARAAAAAGSACTALAADPRAELWLTRAIRTSRRMKDWEWHARAYLRLGLHFYETGDVRRARRAHHRARSSAIWSGHNSFAATAHHNLLMIECSAGTYIGGEVHARQALALYPAHHARLPHLGHDVACLMACHGAHRDALAVLDAAAPLFTRAWERVALMGTIALAAAGVGDRQRHADAVADLMLLAGAAETHAAGALSLAAEGAEILGETERARRLAERAADLAERRREREPLRRARRILDGVPAPRQNQPAAERTGTLRTLFVARLRELRGTGGTPVVHTELVQSTLTGR